MVRRAALVALLALATAAGASRLTTFEWGAAPGWPAGTTVELCGNDVCETGITTTQHTLDVPVEPGGVIQGRARAHSGEQSSSWVELAQTWPASPIGIRATQERIAMAISASALTTGGSGTNGTGFTTASVSPGSNRLLLLGVGFSGVDASGSFPSCTISGNGLTWELVASQVSWAEGANWYNITRVYRAMGASPSSGAITITFGATADSAGWTLLELDGVNTGGTNGSAAVVQSASAEATSGSNVTATATLGAFASAANATVGIVSSANGGGTAVSHTPGTGFTELSDGGAEFTYMSGQWRSDNDTTVNNTSTGQFIAVIGIEVADAGGGPAGASLVTPANRFAHMLVR